MNDKMLAVGIDPDTKSTGIAAVQYFNGGFQVVHVGIVRAKGRFTGDRRIEMARNLIDVMTEMELPYTPTAVVTEWQHIRPRGEKRPNNICDLNGIAGMCALVGTFTGAKYHFTPIPSEWKKDVPKPIHQKRIVSRLHLTMDLCYQDGYGSGQVPGAEVIPKSMLTHVIDAIGLACWAVGPHGPVYDMRMAERITAEK